MPNEQGSFSICHLTILIGHLLCQKPDRQGGPPLENEPLLTRGLPTRERMTK